MDTVAGFTVAPATRDTLLQDVVTLVRSGFVLTYRHPSTRCSCPRPINDCVFFPLSRACSRTPVNPRLPELTESSLAHSFFLGHSCPPLALLFSLSRFVPLSLSVSLSIARLKPVTLHRLNTRLKAIIESF